MIKIALIKNDGTWEEKILRLKPLRFSNSLPLVWRHLNEIKFMNNYEYPEGIVEIAILPNNWDRPKKKAQR